MGCHKRTYIPICGWILTLGALIPWSIIYTYYVVKYDVPHLTDPNETDLVLSTTESNPKIITDITFTSASIDCNTAYPTTYQKCSDSAPEKCEDKPMCIAYLTDNDFLGSMALAFEGGCNQCSDDMAQKRMAYSTGSSITRDDHEASCFFGTDNTYSITYLLCLPSFYEIYQQYVGLAMFLLVLWIILAVLAVIATIYVVYKKINEEKQQNKDEITNVVTSVNANKEMVTVHSHNK